MSTNIVWRWAKRIAIASCVVMLLIMGAGFVVYRRMLQPNENIGPTVSQNDKAAETLQLQGMGAVLPNDGFVLDQPFKEPLNGRSFVVPRSWWPQGMRLLLVSHRSVRADKLLLDLDVLQAAMSRNYGGWESAERAGWNWSKWFDDWRAMLRNAGTRELSMDEAFAPMDAYAAFRIDNHTNIPWGRFTTSSLAQTARMSKAAPAPCTEIQANGKTAALRGNDAGEQPRVAVTPDATFSKLDTAHYISLPSRLGKLERVHCGNDWIELSGGRFRQLTLLSILRMELSKASLQIERLSDSAVYVRLPTFQNVNYQNIDAVAAAAPKPNGHESVLIVDVRDNGGGSAELSYPLLKPWIDMSRLPRLNDMRATRAMSCLYHALRWNFGRPGLRTSRGNSAAVAALQADIDTLMQSAPIGCTRSTVTESGRITYGRHGLHPDSSRLKILVWTNGGCGSDCEFLVAQLAVLSETVIVGTNTGGVMQFIQPGPAILPNTRLPIRMALGESDVYADGRSVDGHGLDVDVLLPEETLWAPRDLVKLAALLRAR